MKKLFSFVLFFSVLALFAQPVIQFDKTTFDFGNIKEESGKATGKFEFSNTGDKDLIITSVKPGCGCTAADYTKTPVPPGGRGFINATYDPYGRPGSFNKNIKVSTNEPKFDEDSPNNSPYVIFIKGSVEKRPPTKFETAGYKNGNGNIRIKDNNVKLELLNTEFKTFTIQVMNFSEKESTFELLNAPNHISTTPTTIKAGEEKEITFKFDAVTRGEIGSFRDNINIQTQDSLEPRLMLMVESVVKEDFSKMTTKQLNDAPKAEIETLELDFGKIEKNKNPSLQVKLYNKGKNPLLIRQNKSSNTVFSVAVDKKEVSKDDFATLTITVNSRNRKGGQNATIEIITNDPAQSLIVLNCKGNVSQ
jgi:hypothetical protein